MRVYLPATMSDLVRLRDTGGVGGVGVDSAAYAVTPALREWYAESDTEELEHAAFGAAERHSLHRLAADAAAPRLRVVISADLPDTTVRSSGGNEPGAVLVDGDITLAAVASIHVDEADARADVGAAVDALDAAARGDDDAQFVVDGAEGHDLLWFDVTELDDVVAANPS